MRIEFDDSFDKIKNLRWRPFIGEKYFESNKKILFIGESHYMNPEEINPNFDNPNFTRMIVSEMGIEEYDYRSKFFKNINKMFVSGETINLWNKISFYNFIQRPMNSIKEKPNNNDFRSGWEIFFEIVNILKPETCIFFGNKCADFFNNHCSRNNVPFNKIIWYENLNGAYLKFGQVELNKKMNLIFIKHPSMAFNTNKWLNLLVKKYPLEINYLKSNEL